MHANDFLGTYRTQATAFPVHLTIRLYDPTYTVPYNALCTRIYTIYIYSILQAIVSVIFRNNFARSSQPILSFIVPRQKFERVTIMRVHVYILHIHIIYIKDRRKHTFLSPTDTGLKKKKKKKKKNNFKICFYILYVCFRKETFVIPMFYKIQTK
jgi:uncharacterized membrane protein